MVFYFTFWGGFTCLFGVWYWLLVGLFGWVGLTGVCVNFGDWMVGFYLLGICVFVAFINLLFGVFGFEVFGWFVALGGGWVLIDLCFRVELFGVL